MAKDYKNVVHKKPGNNGPGVLHKLLPFITGLALGLLITLGIYLTQQNSSWMPFQAKSLAIETPLPAPPVVRAAATVLPTVEEETSVPPPKFDFYNILPNKELNISEWVADEPALEQISPQDANSVFILQVGSFKQLEAADQVKAQLALLGITANIQRMVINGQDAIYRVRVGPYTDQKQLNEARVRLQENKLEFMLLKLQADDPRLTDG